MVHALEEIHRLLRPEGVLTDIHPFPESPIVEVRKDGNVLFAAPKRETDSEDVLEADEALTQVVERRLYAVERGAEFEFLTYGSSVAEYLQFRDLTNAYDERPKEEEVAEYEAKAFARADEMMHATGEGAEIAFHEKARISRLKPIR